MTNIQAFREQSAARAAKLANIAKVITDAPERPECDFGYATPTEPAIDLRAYMADVSGELRVLAGVVSFCNSSFISSNSGQCLEDLADQIDTVLEAGAK